MIQFPSYSIHNLSAYWHQFREHTYITFPTFLEFMLDSAGLENYYWRKQEKEYSEN